MKWEKRGKKRCSGQTWSYSRERTSDFSLEYRAIRSSAVFGTRRKTALRGECETPRNPDFLRKDKMIILVKIRNFSKSRITKRTSPLESSHEI